jgi:rubrerythrin
MIIISVNRKPSTGEWLASVSKDGRFLEGPTAYTDDPEDAVNIAISMIEQYRKRGEQAELSDALATTKQVAKYRPDWARKDAVHPNTATQQNLAKSMSEEAQASFNYKARGLTSDKKTNDLYVHIAKEEDGHYDEFSKRLNEIERS